MKPRGKPVAEGKTKKLFRLSKGKGYLLLHHKDDITAGDGEKHEMLLGKAVSACRTTTNTFRLLNLAGIPTHLLDKHKYDLEPNQMIVRECDMIRLEVVARRVATGSYLKRNPHIKEGTIFVPLVTEFFLKDDKKHDPLVKYDPATDQWLYWDARQPRYSQIPVALDPSILVDGRQLTSEDLETMRRILIEVFEVLEQAWQTLGVQLVDLKIEFGFDKDGNLIVSDVIDNDSWRIWPAGDKRMQLDKQVFRELDVITTQEMATIKGNYERVADLTDHWLHPLASRVVILYGSKSDSEWVSEIENKAKALGLVTVSEVYSADKLTDETLEFVRRTDRSGVNVVYIASAGRRNALGGIDFHTTNMVINCPPSSEGPFAIPDLLSSLRVPSGIGAVTVMYPEAAAIAAAKHLAANDLVIWLKLRRYQREVKSKVRG